MAEGTLTRERYLDAGLALLAEGGSRAVTIATLCDRLAVTKGSFYHHFRSGPAFMRALLAHWELTAGCRLTTEALAVADPAERLEVMQRNAIGLHHAAETAIRALARTDPFADEVLRRVDAGRTAVLDHTLRQAGLSPERARRLARAGVCALVGAQHLDPPPGTAEVAEVMSDYERWLRAELTR